MQKIQIVWANFSLQSKNKTKHKIRKNKRRICQLTEHYFHMKIFTVILSFIAVARVREQNYSS